MGGSQSSSLRTPGTYIAGSQTCSLRGSRTSRLWKTVVRICVKWFRWLSRKVTSWIIIILLNASRPYRMMLNEIQFGPVPHWRYVALRVLVTIDCWTKWILCGQISNGTVCIDAVLNAFVDDVMALALVGAVFGAPWRYASRIISQTDSNLLDEGITLPCKSHWVTWLDGRPANLLSSNESINYPC